MVQSGKGLISVSQELSASVGGAFILAGGGALDYHSLGFGHFPVIS